MAIRSSVAIPAALWLAATLGVGCTRSVLSKPVPADVYLKDRSGEFVWMGSTPYYDKNLVWDESCWRVEAPGYETSEVVCAPGGPDTITILYYLEEARIDVDRKQASLDIGAALRDAKSRFEHGDLSDRQYRRLRSELIWAYIGG